MSENFSNPFADVRLQPVRVGGKEVASKLAVQVQDDDGDWQVKAFVGRDYQLMTNRLVYDLAEDVMSRAPAQLGGFNHLKNLWNGKQFVAFFASREPVVSLAGNGGKLQVGLMAWNSYDSTRKVGFEVYALNAFCTNQYHSRNRFGFFAWRHQPGDLGQIDREDAAQAISVGLGNVMALAPALEELRANDLTLDQVLAAKKELAIPPSRWGDILDRLRAEEEKNLFGLYQALTYVASHHLTAMAAVNVGSAITDYFLSPKAPVINHTDAQTVLAGKA